MDLTIVGGSVLCPDGRVDDATITITDGVIHAVGDARAAVDTLDATGCTVVPGFIDLQCNGAVGVDLGTDPQRMWEIAAALPQWGVTAWLPTVVTGPAEIRDRATATLADRPDDFVGAEPLGLHFEGPFIAPDRLGAHRARHRRDPDPVVADGWSLDAGVAMVTLAPELPGALELVDQLTDRGVVVSAGHSSATFDDAMAAFDAGVTAVTHLFNAMAPMHHRDPGLAGAALADLRVTVGLIADGHHVHPAMVRTAAAALGSRLALVTDAVAALGADPATLPLDDLGLVVDADTVRLRDGTLAGSLLSLDRAVANAVDMAGRSRADAIGAVTATPAALLADERRGRIEIGRRGDLVVLDGTSVVATVIGGRIAHDVTGGDGHGDRPRRVWNRYRRRAIE